MNAKTKTKTKQQLSQQTARFIAALTCNLPHLTSEEMQEWIDSPAKTKKFLAGLKHEKARAKTKDSRIILPIDYTKSLEEMIAASNYDWKDDNITEKHFPIVGKGVVEYEFHYCQFGRNISSQTVVDLIKEGDSENPWEPAWIEHLLALGKSLPEEQRKSPIVALGSVGRVGGFRRVLCLGSERYLYLGWFDDVWHARCRFLAVRKVTRISES